MKFVQLNRGEELRVTNHETGEVLILSLGMVRGFMARTEGNRVEVGYVQDEVSVSKPVGGTYEVSVNGKTETLAWNASPEKIQAAIDRISRP